MIKWLRNKLNKIKWRRMRANYKLAPEDWWDFKYTLADVINQGLTGLLYEGVTDWDCEHHKQEKEDLEFILEWAREFPFYESGILASDTEDFNQLCKRFGGEVFIFTKEELEDFEKKTQKAFKLLAKNIHTLWD